MSNDETKKQSTEVAITAAGALVGFAIGGPIGAVVGGTTAPAVKLAHQIIQKWMDRRKQRITNALNSVIAQSGLSDEKVFEKLENNEELSDDIVRLLRQLLDTDPELDTFFAKVIVGLIVSDDRNEANRLLVLSDAVKGLNRVQVQIIRLISCNDGILSAECIAQEIGIPEIELRNAVRDLELRGIITDNDSNPTVWELRELGVAISDLLLYMEGQGNV